MGTSGMLLRRFVLVVNLNVVFSSMSVCLVSILNISSVLLSVISSSSIFSLPSWNCKFVLGI